MIYPEFLKKGDVIGVCAPSAGLLIEDTEYEASVKCLNNEGYTIKETKNVHTELLESAPPEVRGEEFNQLIADKDVDAVICAAGGDFLISMLPYVDYDAFAKNPKWIEGYSDPTSLLYSITTKLDIATVYGANASGFWHDELHRSLRDNLDILKGDVPVQESFELYERDRSGRAGGFNLTERVEWVCPNGDFTATGRLLGGCLDCITDVVGTEFDGTREFIERYKDDGILWYFDIFSLKAEMVHNVLFKMKHMGLFKYAKGFIFGRVCFPATFADITYIEAAKKILGDAPMVFEADIGHVAPKFTVINGALGTVECKDGKGKLEMKLV